LKKDHQKDQNNIKEAKDLAERGEGLLEPVRQRKGTFWAVLGFSLGLTAALIVTYLFVRQRWLQPETDEGQQIELPQNEFHESTPTTAVEEPSAQPTAGE
jgi:hypothetical protein